MLKQKEMDKAGGALAKELAAQAEELKAARAQVRPKTQTALSRRHRGRLLLTRCVRGLCAAACGCCA